MSAVRSVGRKETYGDLWQCGRRGLSSFYKKELTDGRDGGPGPQSAPKVPGAVYPDQLVCRLVNLASRNSGVYNLFFGCVTATIVRIVPCADVLGVVVIKPGVEKRTRLLVT